MTVYTCNLLCKHDVTGTYRPRLWADDPNEAIMAALAVGAEMHDFNETQGFESYLITEDQQAWAICNGAVMTDYLEPRYQKARREGDELMMRSIELSRKSGLTGGTHPKQADAA